MNTRQVWFRWTAGLVAAIVILPGAFAQQKSVEQRLQELEQEIQALKQQQALAKEATTTTPVPTTVTNAPIVKADGDGFFIQSASGNFKLRIGGYAQADGRFYLNDKIANNGTDTFLMRRVRPILEGTVFRDFDFRVMPDFGNGTTVLEDAYVEWKYLPWLKVRAGKFKPEVGLEWQQSDNYLFFIERGLPSGLLPQRDAGLQVSGDLYDGVIHYAGGVYNGVVDGGIADTDTWDSKDATARIFVQPFKKTEIQSLQGLGFGVAGTIGNQHSGSTTNLASYKTTGQNSFFTYQTTGNAASGLEIRGTPQACYYWGPFGLLSEYVFAQQEISKGTTRNNFRNTAWDVETSFVLTGEKASFNGVTPNRPFDLKKGGWGALELAGRYGDLRFDPAAFSTFADPTKSAQEAREWGVGLNWYLNRNVKLALDYEETSFDGGAGTTGNVRNRATEETIFTRAQVAF